MFDQTNLVLYEEEWKHGWQTFFRVKCQRCHSEHATFPSSRSLDIPSHHTCVNVPFTPIDMNEVTMRSVLATHSTGMSWRDLHKIATIFDMPPPVQAMPSRYAIRLEAITKSAVRTSMSEAADQLHKKVDSEPSPEPTAVNREKALLKSEGGGSYRGGHFGSESTQSKMRRQTRGRARQTRRVSTGVKRKLKERTTPSISSPSSDDASISSDESTTLCAICNQREPDPVALRRVGKKIESQWVCCDVCSDWVHCYCADVEYDTVSAGSFTCDKCS